MSWYIYAVFFVINNLVTHEYGELENILLTLLLYMYLFALNIHNIHIMYMAGSKIQTEPKLSHKNRLELTKIK